MSSLKSNRNAHEEPVRVEFCGEAELFQLLYDLLKVRPANKLIPSDSVGAKFQLAAKHPDDALGRYRIVFGDIPLVTDDLGVHVRGKLAAHEPGILSCLDRSARSWSSRWWICCFCLMSRPISSLMFSISPFSAAIRASSESLGGGGGDSFPGMGGRTVTTVLSLITSGMFGASSQKQMSSPRAVFMSGTARSARPRSSARAWKWLA
ncbi:hypothetical protein OUZ56_032654 [Daphnia magna]|uniref:Uncharacterized protein n=1 Tax=Daphnia magna TaxID=35525 RepID=A0ABR0B9I5_9CRUS|nr:hypothetical protein OUZ56_032654 [Daphnia magna]